MKSVPLTNWLSFNNILYIGDEPKLCISIIEKFSLRLLEIEQSYKVWFDGRNANNVFAGHDKLQYHIHYHFEGGMAVFKFKEDDELPAAIRNECIMACKNIAAEQLLYAS